MPKSRLLVFAGVIIGIAICAVAAKALHMQLSALSWSDVRFAITSMSLLRLGAAALLIVGSYAWLANYDRLGLWASQRRPTQARIMTTSFVAYAVSKSLGFPAITSGLVRLRRYRDSGFGLGDLTRFVIMTGTTLWLGFAMLMGALLMITPTSLLPLGDGWQRALGVALLAIGLAWVALGSKGLGVVTVRSWHFRMPTAHVAGAQLVVGAVDWLLLSSVLWMLLPSGTALHEVILAVGVAQMAAVLAHVPGGAGVVEATLLMLFKDRIDPAALAGSLVAFRVMYFLVPLALAGVFVAIEHAVRSVRRLRSLAIPMPA